MKKLTHKTARFLVQESKERKLSTNEEDALKKHLATCNDCNSYYQLHTWLKKHSVKLFALPNNMGDEIGQVINKVSIGVGRRRKIQRAINAAQTAAFLAVVLFISVLILPRLRDFISISDSSQVSSGVEISSSPRILDTVAATSTATVQPSPDTINTPPPRPQFDFGKKVPWSEVSFFQRGDSDISDSEALNSASRTKDRVELDLEGFLEKAGFSMLSDSLIPEGYQFEIAWYDSGLQSLRICYIGPLIPKIYSHPRLCIVQQKSEFQDFVGRSADIYHTYVDDVYAEYVHGGWLNIGQNGSTRQYQWDDRMVPVTELRFYKNGLFFEVSLMIGCEGPECLDLEGLISIAENID